MKRSSKTAAWPDRAVKVLASRRAFWVLVGLFIVQAAWLALSGRYPMAFDEDFHLGIIRLYAHHISPFWSSQPAGADMYGAVARDPSYLYHWLMSFPYRLISAFTADQTLQVLWLRAINIGLFVSGLVLFRRLLARSGASAAMINACYAVFILIPVMPLLAAQINYDNLLLPLTAICLLLVLDTSETMRQQRPLPVGRVVLLFCLCFLSCLVKYAFLPIFVAIVIFLLWRGVRSYGSWRKLGLSLGFGWTLLSRPARWLLPALLVICFGLFSQRYIVNVVSYHTPIPDCSKVLDVEACSDYGPWIRDYTLSHDKVNTAHNPLVFTNEWFYGMWLRLFFTVDGPATQFETRGPLLLPALVGIVFPILVFCLLLRYGRRLWQRYDHSWIALVGLISVVYIGALWLDEYRAFLRTGQPVAINGRYLLPTLLPLLLVAVMACGLWLGRNRALKAGVLGIGLLGLLWGGGALTYVLRSNSSWYWNSWPVQDVNQTIRRTVGPLVPGYRTPTQFLR